MDCEKNNSTATNRKGKGFNITLAMLVIAVIGHTIWSVAMQVQMSHLSQHVDLRYRSEALQAKDDSYSTTKDFVGSEFRQLRSKRSQDPCDEEGFDHLHMSLASPSVTYINATGYLEWKSDNGCLRKSTISHGLQTPVIKQGGLYLIYCQLAWMGKQGQPEHAVRAEGHKTPSFNVIALPDVNSTTKNITDNLMTSMVTQYNLGGKLYFQPTPMDQEKEYAHDTVFISGVFRLEAEQVLAVTVRQAVTVINNKKDLTYFGYYRLSA